MTESVNIHEAKTNFSKLVRKVESGEEVLIARGGKPVMKLVPLTSQEPKPRDFRSLQGLITGYSDELWEQLEAEHLTEMKALGY